MNQIQEYKKSSAQVETDYFDSIINRSIGGWRAGRLKLDSVDELLDYYKRKYKGMNIDELCIKITQSQAKRSFGVGFITSIGGFALLPVQLTAGMAGTLIIQARLISMMAKLNGLDLNAYEVRTLIKMLTLCSTYAEALKDVAADVGGRIVLRQLNRIPSAALRSINKTLGVKLLTKAGKKSLISWVKIVPLIGGAIGGTIDYTITIKTGQYAAKELKNFRKNSLDDLGENILLPPNLQ